MSNEFSALEANVIRKTNPFYCVVSREYDVGDIYGLKIARWLDIGQVLFWRVYGPNGVEVHKIAKKQNEANIT